MVSTRSAFPVDLPFCIPATCGAQAEQENFLWWLPLKEAANLMQNMFLQVSDDLM